MKGALKINLGNNIRRARGQRSQIEVAKLLSISVNTLSAYENNRSLPPIETFKEICRIFNLSADKLFKIDDISNTPANKGEMLSHKLANVRDQLEFTQKKMANLLDVSVGTWSKYETGNLTPPLSRLQRICEICKVSANYLLGLQVKN